MTTLGYDFNANFPPPPDLTPYIARGDDQYIAGGGFGDVYRRWYHYGPPKEVAVKAFRFKFSIDEDANNRSTKMIRRELGIWRRLNHANIVPFMGIAYGFGMRGAMSLVSLWMHNGSLHHFLEKYADTLTVQHRLKFLLDIANGLYYLHSFPIVHGDLNCNNILLDADYTARLADFGYASLVGSIPEALTYLQRSTTHPGALRWSPPEQMEPRETFHRTTKSDIYSFGCIVLQESCDGGCRQIALSGKQPWSEIREDMAVVLQLARGRKPSRPVSCMLNDAHWGFIQQCWSAIEERPTAGVIVHTIAQFLDSALSPLHPVESTGRLVKQKQTTAGLRGDANETVKMDVSRSLGYDTRHPDLLGWYHETMCAFTHGLGSGQTEPESLCEGPSDDSLGRSWAKFMEMLAGDESDMSAVGLGDDIDTI